MIVFSVKCHLLSSCVPLLSHLCPFFLFIAVFIDDEEEDGIGDDDDYGDLGLELRLIFFLTLIHFFY